MVRQAKHNWRALAVGAGACAVVALGAALLLAVPGTAARAKAAGAAPTPARDASPARVTRPASGEMARLAARVDELTASQDTLWTELAAKDAAGDATAPITESEYAAAVSADMADRLSHEPADPAWAPETERVVARAVAAVGAGGSRLIGVDCRATLCRFEVGHDGELARDRFITAILPALPFDTEMFYRQVEDDRGSRTIGYVARAGHHLPRAASSR